MHRTALAAVIVSSMMLCGCMGKSINAVSSKDSLDFEDGTLNVVTALKTASLLQIVRTGHLPKSSRITDGWQDSMNVLTMILLRMNFTVNATLQIWMI